MRFNVCARDRRRIKMLISFFIHAPCVNEIKTYDQERKKKLLPPKTGEILFKLRSWQVIQLQIKSKTKNLNTKRNHGILEKLNMIIGHLSKGKEEKKFINTSCSWKKQNNYSSVIKFRKSVNKCETLPFTADLR